MSDLVSTIKPKDIPYKLNEDWEWFKWGDIIEKYQQGLIRSNSQLNSKEGVDYFKMSFMNENGNYSFDNLPKTYASKKEIIDFKLEKGNFLINVRNSKELVGKCCAIYSVNREILYNHMIVRIKHKKFISGNFISAYLNTPFGKKLLDTCKKGTTTVIALYQKDIYNLPIPIPSKNILQSIDKIYNNLNEKIELNNKINIELEQMAKTLYDYWFVQFDFPNEDGKPYKSSGGEMVYDKVLKRDIPKGWEVKDFGKIFQISRGTLVTKDSSTKGNYKVVSAGVNYSYLHGEYNREKFTITVSGSGANAGFVNFWTERIFACDCTTVRGKTDGETFLGLQFLKVFQNHIYSQAKGSAQPHVYPSDIKCLKYLQSGSDLEEKIGNLFKSVYEKIGNNLKQNQELASLRDWLLPMLMNGQVKVGESDGEILGLVAEERDSYNKKTQND